MPMPENTTTCQICCWMWSNYRYESCPFFDEDRETHILNRTFYQIDKKAILPDRGKVNR